GRRRTCSAPSTAATTKPRTATPPRTARAPQGTVRCWGGGSKTCRRSATNISARSQPRRPASTRAPTSTSAASLHKKPDARRAELLHDPDDVEVRDTETAVLVVEHAQPEEIPESQRVVGDRLRRHEDAVARRAEAVEHRRRAGTEKVRITEGRPVAESCGVDAEGVLQIRADVSVRVVDRRDTGDARKTSNALRQ